jgi:hypothetical protein
MAMTKWVNDPTLKIQCKFEGATWSWSSSILFPLEAFGPVPSRTHRGETHRSEECRIGHLAWSPVGMPTLETLATLVARVGHVAWSIACLTRMARGSPSVWRHSLADGRATLATLVTRVGHVAWSPFACRLLRQWLPAWRMLLGRLACDF